MKHLSRVALRCACVFAVALNWHGNATAGPRAAGVPVVHTSAGAVAGVDGAVRVFKGIPYAAPPLGMLRWRAPQPPRPWTGVRDASHFGDDCMQVPYVIPTGQEVSEDCLTLSIWTPERDGGPKRPVLVYLYGGGFIGGSVAYPLYDATKLASHGAVVVSVSYRVGIFGFLAHPQLTAESPHHASGNYGLLDQIAALQWVQQNIAAFGGDPARVTVFGESAGAVSIAMLMTAPLARGLFARAALFSPDVMRLATLPEAEASGARLAPDLARLRAMSAAELVKHNLDFFPQPRHRLMTMSFPAPIVDGYVLPVQPRDPFTDGTVRPLPLLLGTAAIEGRMFSEPHSLAAYQEWLRGAFGPLADNLQRLNPAADDAAATTAAAAVLGDAMFGDSARLIARGVAAHPTQIFVYLFSRSAGGAPQPATHSEVLPYLFGTLDRPSFLKHLPADAIDLQLSASLQQYLTRFAANGDPNGPGLPRWPAYERSTEPYLEFGSEIRPGAAYRRAQLDALEPFYAP